MILATLRGHAAPPRDNHRCRRQPQPRLTTAGNSVVSTASSYVPQSWSETNSQYMLSYSSMAYISTIVTVIVLCIVIAMRNAIRVSVEGASMTTCYLRD